MNNKRPFSDDFSSVNNRKYISFFKKHRRILKQQLKELLIKSNKDVYINYYNKNNEKRVLISYIIYPFVKDDIKPTHINYYQARAIASVFDELGYNVDIINYDNNIDIDITNYAIVIGWGYALEKAIKLGITSILFLTGASPHFQNIAEGIRAVNFKKRHIGSQLKLRRQVEYMDVQMLLNVRYAICGGNEWVKSTYDNLIDNIFGINIFGLGDIKVIERDISLTKKNFLFLSGTGNLHKGLDVLLESFSELQDMDLYIATKLDDDFIDYYKDLLLLDNIHHVGFLDVDSSEFIDIAKKCSFCILPSCSEGQASSVLTAMNKGLIPVVSREVGLDADNIGVYIEETSPQYLCELLRELSNMDDSVIQRYSTNVIEEMRVNYSYENFYANLKKIIIYIVNEGE